MAPSAVKVRMALTFLRKPGALPGELRSTWLRLDRWAREAGLGLAPMLAAYGLPDDMPLQERMAEAEALAAEAARVLAG